MKLCRFELKTEPGIARSGMVYSGKIYETNGAEAVAVHDADAVRPLAPIPHSPSVRVFHREFQSAMIAGMDQDDPNYFYMNPTGLLGASQVLSYPIEAGEMGVETFLAAVVVSDAYQVPIEVADDLILGYTLLAVLVSRTMESRLRRVGSIGRAYDFGAVLGPVVTTPDEMEESVDSDAAGRRYDLSSVLRVNGVERGRGNANEVPFTAAQAIVAAGQGVPLRAGDLIALGPLVSPDSPIALDPGDEVQLSVESLGTISLKLALTG